MKVAIRDDDTSYFTTPEALDRVYGDVWDRMPVCLAVVPFAIGYEQPGIPPEHWHSGESFALDRNPELVSFLRELIGSKRVTIALHGCTHQDFPDGYEFQAAPDLPDRVLRGRAYLESLLGCRISLFVPPHNALSKRGRDRFGAGPTSSIVSVVSTPDAAVEWRTAANWWTIQRYRRATGRTRRESPCAVPLATPHANWISQPRSWHDRRRAAAVRGGTEFGGLLLATTEEIDAALKA
jgi:hypothetical protein